MITGLVLLTALALAPAAVAANNAGDVKVKNPDGTGSPENHPHVGCTFFIEGFNMDDTSGSITFWLWPPSGEKHVVHATGSAETWTADDTNEQGNHHFLSGPYSLPAFGDHPQGTHYKVFVSDTKHDKMKVFWTQCEQPPPCGDDCNPPPCTQDCTPPPPCDNDCTPPPCEGNDCAEVPFFPTTGAMALGLVGAVGCVALAVRRRMT